MGIGKHGMSHEESRAAQDKIEWSPSKNAASSRIATSGDHTSGSHHTRHSKGPATPPAGMKHGKSTEGFKGSGGGGGGHNKKGKKY